jgi:hypothetical protein
VEKGSAKIWASSLIFKKTAQSKQSPTEWAKIRPIRSPCLPSPGKRGSRKVKLLFARENGKVDSISAAWGPLCDKQSIKVAVNYDLLSVMSLFLPLFYI